MVNEFYTRFLFKIGAHRQEVGFLLDIAATFFNNLSPDVREFLILEGVQVPQRLPIETNHKGNQRLILFINAAVESEKKTITIKAAVQSEGVFLYHRTFVRIPGGITSIKTAGLSIIFKYEGKNSILVETMGYYALASAEAAYENPVEQAPMGFMASGG